MLCDIGYVLSLCSPDIGACLLVLVFCMNFTFLLCKMSNTKCCGECYFFIFTSCCFITLCDLSLKLSLTLNFFFLSSA